MAETAVTPSPSDFGASPPLLWLDFLIVALIALTGGLLDNPVLLALAAYAAIILARDGVCIVVRRHGRGRHAHRYEFGTGKLEQAANLALASIKVAIGLWLAYLVLGDGRLFRSLPTQGELRICALVSALYTIRCLGLVWIGSGRVGSAVKPIGSSTRMRLLVAVAFQSVVTIAAIAKDPVLVGLELSVGMLLVALALLLTGIRQSRDAVLDLVDHPLDSTIGEDIRGIVRSLEPEVRQMVADIRARRAGNDLFVELTVAAEPRSSFEEVQPRISDLRQIFVRALPGSDVVITLISAPLDSSG